MPGRIEGSVYWIEKGKPTDRLVDAAKAFSDPSQAVAQVLSAEASSDARQQRLARLAYIQFQGKRYRSANRPKKASKPTGKKRPSIAKSRNKGRTKKK